MRIKRKLFSNPQEQPQMTSKDIQIEQMKLQRQLLTTQRMEQKLKAEERRSEMNRIIQQQRMEQRKDLEEDKQRVRIKKMEQVNNDANTSLYKTKSRPVPPVAMK